MLTQFPKVFCSHFVGGVAFTSFPKEIHYRFTVAPQVLKSRRIKTLTLPWYGVTLFPKDQRFTVPGLDWANPFLTSLTS